MEKWELAEADYKQGMKYKDIAEKYEVSLSTVKSWAARHWKKEEVATKGKKGSQPSSKKSQPKKKKSQPKVGAPKGNQNAVGNNGGAPARNQNHLQHGIYSKVYWDTLDEDELQLVGNMSYEEEDLLEEQIALLTVREHRFLVLIKKHKEKGGLSISSVVTHKWIPKDKTEASGTDSTIMASSDESIIHRYENELTKIQARKTRCIEALAKLRALRKTVGGFDPEAAAATVQIYIPDNGRRKKDE